MLSEQATRATEAGGGAGAPRRGPRATILVRLLGATLGPTVAVFVLFGLLANWVARTALEDELSRRLIASARSAALTVKSERPDLLQPGDEDSRSYKNVRRKLGELREAVGAARIYLFDAGRGSHGDTDEGIPIGTRYFRLDENRSEVERAFAGEASSSLLFIGRDGAFYKSGYAPLLDDSGAVVGVVGVEGAAAFYEQLKGFRRTLFAAGAAFALLVVVLSFAVAQRITRPVRELVVAARSIGEGRLEEAIVALSSDEIGYLAEALDTMRRQLRARDERLQMMLAGIAHEVRNPLAGMELFVGMLREDLTAGSDGAGALEAGGAREQQLANVRRIERELKHLETIVSDFLDYARRPRPEPARVDVCGLLAEVCQVLAADAAAAQAELRLEGEPGAIAWADPAQLRRALVNLGKNAIQATAGGGHVVLSSATDDAGVRIAVSDDGRGIADEVRASLFTPFFTTREKGTGLGLAFVAEFARDHGGVVDLRTAIGAGSTFTLVLPRKKPIAGSDETS